MDFLFYRVHNFGRVLNIRILDLSLVDSTNVPI